MELPRFVMIDGKRYTVLRRKPPSNQHVKERAVGAINRKTKKIYVDPSDTRPRQNQTLIHEVVHGAVPDLNEDAVICIEEAVWSAIKDRMTYD